MHISEGCLIALRVLRFSDIRLGYVSPAIIIIKQID